MSIEWNNSVDWRTLEESSVNKTVEIWGVGTMIILGILVYASLELIKEIAETGTFDLLTIIGSDWEFAKDLSGDL